MARDGLRIVTREDAIATYEKRSGHGWEGDAFFGTLFAMTAEASRTIVRAAAFLQRRTAGERLPAPPTPLPAWWFRGRELARRIAGPLTGPLEELPGGAIILSDRSDAHVRRLIEGQIAEEDSNDCRAEVEEFLAVASAAFAASSARRAADEPLQGFYVGTRVQFDGIHGREPAVSEVALLAAALGVAPLVGGLDEERKRWEDRIRRWRRMMRTDAGPWRDIADSIREQGRRSRADDPRGRGRSRPDNGDSPGRELRRSRPRSGAV